MKYSLIIFLIFSSILVKSQNSIITVIDNETELPLSNVEVFFQDIKTSKENFKITSNNGTVTNLSTGKSFITLSLYGYKAIVDTIDNGKSITYKLRKDIFDLNQIVITATRTEKSLKDAPVITQVITAKDIANRGLTNVKDVLEQDIPGLEFQRGGFGVDIKMQGLEAKNILILIDGERLAGESGYNVDYSRLNTENVERIEIVKGAASALYGSQAMGGVINIITKQPKHKIEISLGSKIFETNEINYQNLSTDDYSYTFKNNLDKINYNYFASIGLNLNKFKLRTDFIRKSFDAYQLFDKYGITKNYIDIDTVAHNSLNPFPTGVDGYEDYSVNQKISYKINNKLELNIKGSYYNHNQYDFVPDNVFQNFEDYSFGGNLIYNLDNFSLIASCNSDIYKKFDFFEKLNEKQVNYSNTIINPRLTSVFNFGKKQQITAGAEYLLEKLQSDKFVNGEIVEKETKTSILFIQNDINLTNKLNIILGGRLDIHSAFGTHFSPKLSFMYKLKKVTLRGNYANGFRSPALKELYMEWPIAWFVIKGDENLKPETNNYLSASAEYTYSFINTSITAYKNWLKNKIDGVWSNNQTVYQYVNVSESELMGIELITKVKFLKHFSLGTAYSYLYDKRPQGELVSSASPHSGTLKLGYNFRKNAYDINVNFSSNFIGEKNYEVSEMIEYRGENIEAAYPVHFDGYTIFKFSVNQQFKNGLNITLGVDNIFNYTADIVSFNTSTSPGRKAFISFKIDLHKFYK